LLHLEAEYNIEKDAEEIEPKMKEFLIEAGE
jgi:hypothetical protein